MNVFDASVTLHLIDRVSAGMGQIGLSMMRTQGAADALNVKMEAIQKQFARGTTMLLGGAALATPLVIATKAAIELQTAMGRVQLATGASNGQMQQLNDTLTKTANATGIFSKPKLAEFAADMFASGITKVSAINELLPLFAKGADLMKIQSGGKISAENAAHTFAALSHQFGRYDAASMKPIVEAAVAMAPALPGGLNTLKAMGSYVNVMGNRALGIDPVQLMALEAAVAQTSGGTGTGRGAMSGAQLINALQRSMPGVFGSGLLSGKSAFAAEVMGLSRGGVSTVFKDGKMDLDTLMGKFRSFEKMSGPEIAKKMLANVSMLGKKAPEEETFLKNFLADKNAPKAQLITSLLKYMGGSSATLMQVFGDEKFEQVLHTLQDRIKASKGIEELQKEAMKMVGPQLMRVQTNFMTLASTIGTQMIPMLTLVATKTGDVLDRMNQFAVAHPRIVQTAVALTALASAALIAGGVFNIVAAGFAGLKLMGGAIVGPLGGMLPMLGTALGALGPPGWIAIAAIAAIGGTLFVFRKQIMDFVHSHSGFFIHVFATAGQLAEGLGKAVMGMAKWLAQAASTIGGVIASMPLMGAVGEAIRAAAKTGMAAIDASMKVSPDQQKKDEAWLRSHGGAAAIDLAKGAATARSTASGSKSPSVVNQTNHFHIDGSKNPADTAKAVGDYLKQKVGDIGHAASAISRSGGVPKSRLAFGSGQ